MTARFKSPFIHDFMMKHNPNYKIDSEWGVHKHVAALEKVVKHRRKEEERLQEERQREMDRLAAMNSVREEEQSYTPSQPREENKSSFDPTSYQAKEAMKSFGRDLKYLEDKGYDFDNHFSDPSFDVRATLKKERIKDMEELAKDLYPILNPDKKK